MPATRTLACRERSERRRAGSGGRLCHFRESACPPPYAIASCRAKPPDIAVPSCTPARRTPPRSSVLLAPHDPISPAGTSRWPPQPLQTAVAAGASDGTVDRPPRLQRLRPLAASRMGERLAIAAKPRRNFRSIGKSDRVVRKVPARSATFRAGTPRAAPRASPKMRRYIIGCPPRERGTQNLLHTTFVAAERPVRCPVPPWCIGAPVTSPKSSRRQLIASFTSSASASASSASDASP